MLVRRLKDCQEITAGDNTQLRELLHPDRDYPFTAGYSLAHAIVKPGEKSRPHRLKHSEVYYVTSGSGEIHVDDESETLRKGDVVEIPADSIQWIENSGDCDLEFICIVDPAWRIEIEEIL